MPEIRLMICMRRDEVEEPIPGSTTTTCVECGTDVWLPPDAKKFAAEMKAMPVCGTCAIELADQNTSAVHEFGGTGTISGEAPEQLKELVNKLKGVADRFESNEIPEWLRPKEVDTFEAMKVTARRAGQAMTEPTDDWGAIVIMEGWDGTVFPPVGLSDMMAMGVPKQVLAEQLLPGLAYTANARRVVFGLSTWTLTGDKENPIDPEALEGPISEHPDRQEMLVLIDMDAGGVQKLSSAMITRSETAPPLLGEWKDAEVPSDSKGLFVGAMVVALTTIKELHEKREKKVT